MAIAPSSSDGSAIHYVLLVLWMTSCFYIVERMGQNQRRHACFVQITRWQHWGRSWLSPTASCFGSGWLVDWN